MADETPEFMPFRKVPRLSRTCTVTEKIDGTNASVFISEDGRMLAGCRTRWIYPGKATDNHGFAQWVEDNHEELLRLGPGMHFGEWWGGSIQRRYGVSYRKFSLFNTGLWSDPSRRPLCCDVVPVLYEGLFDGNRIADVLHELRASGSVAVPGCMRPEGIMIYHHAAKVYFKKTLENDEKPKGSTEEG